MGSEMCIRDSRESMDMDDVPKTPKGESGDDKMETDENVVETGKASGEEKDGASSGGKAKKAEKEKVGYELENMSRVLPGQIKYISFSPEGRYQPVKKVSCPPFLPRRRGLPSCLCFTFANSFRF